MWNQHLSLDLLTEKYILIVSQISQTLFSGNSPAESWWRLVSWSKSLAPTVTSWGMNASHRIAHTPPLWRSHAHPLWAPTNTLRSRFPLQWNHQGFENSVFIHLHLFLAVGEPQVVTIWCENCQLGRLDYQRLKLRKIIIQNNKNDSPGVKLWQSEGKITVEVKKRIILRSDRKKHIQHVTVHVTWLGGAYSVWV